MEVINKHWNGHFANSLLVCYQKYNTKTKYRNKKYRANLCGIFIGAWDLNAKNEEPSFALEN